MIMAVTCVLGNGLELSGGDLVLGWEAAEDFSSADPVLGEVDLRRSAMSVGRWQLAQGAVRPGGVVVRQVLGQYLAQVALADDQQPVEDFAPQGPDDPFADGVRFGCQPSSVVGVTANTSPHRCRGITRDSVGCQKLAWPLSCGDAPG